MNLRRTLARNPLRWLGVICYVALTLGPVGLLAVDTMRAVPMQELARTSEHRLGLLWNSVALGTATAAGAVALGTLCAVALWRRPVGRYLRWVAVAMAAAPPYIHLLAWSGFARTLAIPFGGWAAIWWVQTMAFLPFAVILLLAALETLDPELMEAARMTRTDGRVVVRVALPLAAPAMAACGGLLFLLSVTDYSVPALLQRNVYALAIFSEYSAGGDARRAFAMALPLVILSAGAAALAKRALGGAFFTPAASGCAWKSEPQLADRAGIALVVAQASVPLLSLAADAASWRALGQAVSQARLEIGLTLAVGAAAALFALPPGWALARAMERASSLLWLAVLAPLAFPPPVVGLGLIEMWNGRAPLRLHGTLAMPVLAALARFLPLAALAIAAHQRRIDPLLFDAARLHYPSGWKARFIIHLPLALPGVLAAAFFVFALTAGELGATLMVAPPGYQTLSVRIYNYLHFGSSSVVASLSLVLLALGLAAGGAAALVASQWTRLAGGNWRAEG